MLKVLVDYPSPTEEYVVVDRALHRPRPPVPVLRPEDLLALQASADEVYVDPALVEYAVRLAAATRRPGSVGLGQLGRYVLFGASPRASINLVLAARALALLRGRDYAVPADLTDLVLDVFRHRVVLSYEALSDEITADEVIAQVMAAVLPPDLPARAG